MTTLWRKLRGGIGTSLTWGLTWAVAALAIVGLRFLLNPWLDLGAFAFLASFTSLLAGLIGFVGGTVFAMVLGTVHRDTHLVDLSPVRMGLWGALSGLLLPMGMVGTGVLTGAVPFTPSVFAPTILVCGGLGGATALATIKLAQAEELGAGLQRARAVLTPPEGR